MSNRLTNLYVQSLTIDPDSFDTLYAGTYGGSVFLPLAASLPHGTPRIVSPRQ